MWSFRRVNMLWGSNRKKGYLQRRVLNVHGSLSGMAKKKKDPYMWNFVLDICQPVTCQPTFLHFQRHLWSTVSLSAWLSVNLCEQPACRQLNNQTSHQTCSALPSGRAAVRGEGGNKAMEPWMQEKVVERERTGESFSVGSSRRGGVEGWAGVSLPRHQKSI